MYDEQLWYWPEMNAMISLCVYLDGTHMIKSLDVTEDECMDLLKEAMNQVMEVDEYLFVKGLSFLDHITI